MSKSKNLSTEAYDNEETFMVDGLRERRRVEVLVLGPNGTLLVTPMKHSGFIELPGGGLNKNEQVTDAAIRETSEEAGWIITDVKVLPVVGDFVYKAPEGSWLKENGYDLETTIMVSASAISFSPSEVYGSEGDGRPHELMPFQQVIDETLKSIEVANDRRFIMYGKMRLAAIDMLMTNMKFKLSNESMPLYTRW